MSHHPAQARPAPTALAVALALATWPASQALAQDKTQLEPVTITAETPSAWIFPASSSRFASLMKTLAAGDI